MRSVRLWLVLAGVVMLGGCANFGRILSYGTDWADAIYSVQGQRFEMYAHDTDPTLLLTVSIGNAAAQGIVRGATFGIAETAPAYQRWKAAAQWVVEPAGCSVADLRPLDMETTWEFTYVCPPGVDLRALINAQREQLRNGVPLELAR